MNVKKITTAVLLLTCLAFCPYTTSADYPSGTLGYSDEIAVGSEFEWTIKTLERERGTSFYYHLYYFEEFYIGDTLLEQGNKIKIVVVEDPDTAIGAWYDVYVDGNKITNPDDFWLGIWTNFAYSDFFISPITYTNTTGTFDLYEQIFEEFVDEEEDTTSEETSYGNTYRYIEKVDYSLSRNTLTSKAHFELYFSTGIEYIQFKCDLESSVNTENGLLGYSKMYIETDIFMYGYDETAYVNLHIDSKYTNIQFSWIYGFLGITVIATIVFLVKKKRI